MPDAIDPTLAAPSSAAAPTLKKSDRNLVWLDCEMTGLDPEKERLIEIAVVVTGPDLTPRIETTVWQSLALANAMTAMATTRRYAYQSVGALGVIELTAPARAAATGAGLKRLGFSGPERRYFDLHAVLDIKHSEDWNRDALIPLVSEDPRRATAIAEGALIRLKAGERCFAAVISTCGPSGRRCGARKETVSTMKSMRPHERSEKAADEPRYGTCCARAPICWQSSAAAIWPVVPFPGDP